MLLPGLSVAIIEMPYALTVVGAGPPRQTEKRDLQSVVEVQPITQNQLTRIRAQAGSRSLDPAGELRLGQELDRRVAA